MHCLGRIARAFAAQGASDNSSASCVYVYVCVHLVCMFMYVFMYVCGDQHEMEKGIAALHEPAQCVRVCVCARAARNVCVHVFVNCLSQL